MNSLASHNWRGTIHPTYSRSCEQDVMATEESSFREGFGMLQPSTLGTAGRPLDYTVELKKTLKTFQSNLRLPPEAAIL